MNNRRIPFLTFTGADERTDIGELSKLDAEIGLLYSANPKGRNRYPHREWILETVQQLPIAALHICGREARDQLLKDSSLGSGFQRIQVNGKVKIDELRTICELYPQHQIITQHVDYNRPLVQVDVPNHQLLVDSSGGRGQLPSSWVGPETTKIVGYAGGLGPDNIIQQMECIQQIAYRGFWLDMETSLRVDDWFSVERARDCLLQVQEHFGTITWDRNSIGRVADS